jgi:hypothetical protein
VADAARASLTESSRSFAADVKSPRLALHLVHTQMI